MCALWKLTNPQSRCLSYLERGNRLLQMETSRQYVFLSYICHADEDSAHINNLYNTCFWALVQQGGMSTAEAHAELKVQDFFCPKRETEG